MDVKTLNGKHYTEWIRWAIDHKSRGVYDFIQANYDNALPNWAKGFEAATTNKDKMQAFIADKMQKAQNSAQYLIGFLKSVPNS